MPNELFQNENAALAKALEALKKDVDDQQNHIYILAGVLGGVDLALLIAVIVLIIVVVKIKKQIKDAEIQKRLEEEMNAQKLTAYTGEEMHRKLLAVSNPAVPIGSRATPAHGPDSEYAFNPSFVAGSQTGGTRFQRF